MAKLTIKQKAFCDYYLVSLNATESWYEAYNSFEGFKNTHLIPDVIDRVIECIVILEGETYSIDRKRAATLLLKALTTKELMETILDDKELYPYSRKDDRVRNWAEKIKAQGQCEMCGSKEKLAAHHIIRWADYPKGRIDINNGMCLCGECHIKEHLGERVEHLMRGGLECLT